MRQVDICEMQWRSCCSPRTQCHKVPEFSRSSLRKSQAEQTSELRNRRTPTQQFHSLLKGSCCALTWQQADATSCTETSRLMALRFRLKVMNHDKSVPRWIKTRSRVHQQYVFFTLWVCRLLPQASKIGFSNASHRHLNHCTWMSILPHTGKQPQQPHSPM